MTGRVMSNDKIKKVFKENWKWYHKWYDIPEGSHPDSMEYDMMNKDIADTMNQIVGNDSWMSVVNW